MNLIFMKLLIVLSFAAHPAVASKSSDEMKTNAVDFVEMGNRATQLLMERSKLYEQRQEVEDWARRSDKLSELEARLRQKWEDDDAPRQELESLVVKELAEIDEKIREARAALTELAKRGKKQTKDSDEESKASSVVSADKPAEDSDGGIGARSQLDDDKNSNEQRGSKHGAKAKQSARNKRKKRSKKPKPKATPSNVVKKEDIIKLYTCDKAVKESATVQQQLIRNTKNDLIIINDLGNGKGDERIIYTNDEVGILSPSIYFTLISHVKKKEVPAHILEKLIEFCIQAMSRLDATVFQAVKRKMGGQTAVHHDFMSQMQKAYDGTKADAEVQFQIPPDVKIMSITLTFLQNTFEAIVQAKIDQLTQLINATHFREEAIAELQRAQKGIISESKVFFEHCKEQDLDDDAMYVVFADFKNKLDDFNILVANLNVVVRIHHWRKTNHGVIAVLSPLCCEHLDINGYLTSMHYESSAIQRFTIGSGLELQPFPLEDMIREHLNPVLS